MKVELFSYWVYFWVLGLHLNLLQEQVDRKLTVFPTSYWMKLFQIWHQKEEILCGKDANSGIQSKNIHDQKGG